MAVEVMGSLCVGLVTTRPFGLTNAAYRVILSLHMQIPCTKLAQRGRARAGRHQYRCQVSLPPGTSRMGQRRRGSTAVCPWGMLFLCAALTPRPPTRLSSLSPQWRRVDEPV